MVLQQWNSTPQTGMEPGKINTIIILPWKYLYMFLQLVKINTLYLNCSKQFRQHSLVFHFLCLCSYLSAFGPIAIIQKLWMNVWVLTHLDFIFIMLLNPCRLQRSKNIFLNGQMLMALCFSSDSFYSQEGDWVVGGMMCVFAHFHFRTPRYLSVK